MTDAMNDDLRARAERAAARAAARTSARKPGRRRHAAGASRILTVGLSTSAVLAMVATFAMTAPAPAAPTPAPPAQGGTATTKSPAPRPVPGEAGGGHNETPTNSRGGCVCVPPSTDTGLVPPHRAPHHDPGQLMDAPALTGSTTETRFRAMGTDAHVIVVGGSAQLLERARARIDDLEARWSRFLPDSELSRLNAAGGQPVIVASVTFELITRAVDGWRQTRGRFDPTVLPALVAAGYDRSFETVERDAFEPAPPSAPAPGCAELSLDPIVRSVTFPPGVALDLGGIGKGFTADIVSAELLQGGATGACVNVGGDLRVRGTPPDRAWIVAVKDEPGTTPERAPLCVALADGAVATTSSRRRAWRRAGRRQHHVIDPATGRPVHAPPTSATVVAADAWQAEVLAKAAFVAGSPSEAERLLEPMGATGLLVDAAGAVKQLSGLGDFLA
jgi:FAD:protein FMN transferase